MFFRPGGSAKAINRQYDEVYSDTVGGATDWLPVSKGNEIAVNICRASIVFSSPAQSAVTRSPINPEVQVLMELKSLGGVADAAAWPVDQWQNAVVCLTRPADRDGWVRLRILNINNSDGTGVTMALQINRAGNTGVVR